MKAKMSKFIEVLLVYTIPTLVHISATCTNYNMAVFSTPCAYLSLMIYKKKNLTTISKKESPQPTRHLFDHLILVFPGHNIVCDL